MHDGRTAPSVTLVIANHNGAHHLSSCLDSVRALEYPHDRLETIVVDNASRDGSVELLLKQYPWVRVRRLERNVGFAQAVNVGARESDADCLALANNDMRLEPEWLRELVSAYDPRTGYSCVAGLILDWAGSRVDFAEASMNFHGAAMQDRFGDAVEFVDVVDGRELLFACGGSMLINRQLFIDLGGFDPRFFAYFEDVDFGWRLRLAGHKIRLAAGARSFHRHQGTGSRFADYQRFLLLERNALLMLFKNLEERNLHRLIAGALLLLIERARLQTGIPRREFEVGAPSRDEVPVPMAALAPLFAVADLLGELEELADERVRVQSLRVRADTEIFPLFRRPFAPVRTEHAYLEAMATVRRVFDLDRLFEQRRATRVVVVARRRPERLQRVAEGAARYVSVAYAGDGSIAAPNVEGYGARDEAVDELLAEADVVVVDGGGIDVARRARGVVVVVDDDIDDALRDEADAVVDAGDADDALRSIVEEPWRWRREGRPSPATEELQMLLARWRREHGISRGRLWKLGRAFWQLAPPPIRDVVRRARRRAR